MIACDMQLLANVLVAFTLPDSRSVKRLHVEKTYGTKILEYLEYALTTKNSF